MLRKTALALALPLVAGCSMLQDHGGKAAGLVGGVMMASELDYLEPEYLAGALIAYAIYDPLAPTWRVSVTEMDAQHLRLDLRMKALVTGGEGEARRVFERNARKLVEDNGFADYRIVRYEEGIESTRPFATRFASGEIRMISSLTWPEL